MAQFEMNAKPQEQTTEPFEQKGALGAWFDERRGSITGWALAISIILLLLWPHAVIMIPPGHVGVLYKRFFGGTMLDTVYPEGTHFVFPWDRLYIFDARLSEEMHTFSVLTKHGLALEMDVSVIYHPEPSKTPTLLTTVGLDYREKLVIPTLRAAVRSISSQYDKSDFYSETSRSIQDVMHVTMMEALGRNPIIVDNLFIRAVRLPPKVEAAINEKFVAEQEVLRQTYKVQEAAERYKARYIDAQAVRMTQETVNANMNEQFLLWQGIEATRELARSPNSKVVVIGGKDGLPLILNPDAPLSQAPADSAAGRTPGSQKPAQQASQAPTEAVLKDAEGFLERIDLGPLNATMQDLKSLFSANPRQPAPPASAGKPEQR